MNFLNLEYFLAVARDLNITQAATELNVSQQALSKHILNLEKELNLSLFERGRQLSLTEAGTCFVSYAKRILTLRSQMISQICDIAERKDSNIRIGITQARSPVYLPYLLSKFCKAFPEAKIHLTEDASEVIFTDLQNDKLDLVIGIEPYDKLNFTSIPLCIENYAIVAVPEILKKHLLPSELAQLEAHPDQVTIEIFKNCPFLCFDHTKRIGKIFLETCKKIGFQPKIIIESKSLNTFIYLCALGLGVTVCPRVHLEIATKQSETLKLLKIFPVTDLPMQTQIMLTTQRNRYISKFTREFIRIATEEFKFSQDLLTTDANFLFSWRK